MPVCLVPERLEQDLCHRDEKDGILSIDGPLGNPPGQIRDELVLSLRNESSLGKNDT